MTSHFWYSRLQLVKSDKPLRAETMYKSGKYKILRWVQLRGDSGGKARRGMRMQNMNTCKGCFRGTMAGSSVFNFLRVAYSSTKSKLTATV